MNDIASNRTGEYLKAHAEIETEGAALPFKSIPGHQFFEDHWKKLTDMRRERGLDDPGHRDRQVAETWFMWGFLTGKLTP